MRKEYPTTVYVYPMDTAAVDKPCDSLCLQSPTPYSESTLARANRSMQFTSEINMILNPPHATTCSNSIGHS